VKSRANIQHSHLQHQKIAHLFTKQVDFHARFQVQYATVMPERRAMMGQPVDECSRRVDNVVIVFRVEMQLSLVRIRAALVQVEDEDFRTLFHGYWE